MQESSERKRQWLKMGLAALVPAAMASTAAAATATDNVLALLTASMEKLKQLAKADSPGLYKAGEAPGVVGKKASPGCIGEFIAGGFNDAISLPTTTNYCAGSITLPPGIWQISVGAAVAMGAGGRVSDWLVELSPAPNVFSVPSRRGRVGAAAADVDLIATINSFLHVASQTTIYLNTRAIFPGGTVYWSPQSSYFYAIRVG